MISRAWDADAVVVGAGAFGAVPLARSRSWAVSAVTGLAVGPVRLAAAVFSLVDAVLRH